MCERESVSLSTSTNAKALSSNLTSALHQYVHGTRGGITSKPSTETCYSRLCCNSKMAELGNWKWTLVYSLPHTPVGNIENNAF